MSPVAAAAVVAFALAGTPAQPDLVALAFSPADQAGGLAEAALPPPPDRVFLETRTFGTVMVDHRAHLQRKVSCRICHGPGVVSSIAFTPRSAHETCRACHVQAKRGPTSCRDCHVQAEGPPIVSPGERVRFVYRGPGGARIASATSSRVFAPPVAAKSLAVEASKPPEPPRLAPGGEAVTLSTEELAALRDASFSSSREVGFGMLAGAGRTSAATSLRLATRVDALVWTEGLQWATGGGFGSLAALLGGGYVFPLRSRLDVQLLAVGGIDMRYEPSIAVVPVLGATAELRWARSRFPRTVGVALNTTTALGTVRDTYGDRVGGTTVSLGVVAGFGQRR